MADLWGPVVMRPDQPAFEGAEQLTSNSSEVTALLETLRWIATVDVASAAPVLLRPDSEYASKTVSGVWPAQGPNRALILAARALLSQVEEAGRDVWIARVAAHGLEHGWNQRADALASIGAAGWYSGVGRAWQQWPPERRGMPTGADARHGVERCVFCHDDFEDPQRPETDASLPTPADESRAPEELWRCRHAPCRACFAAAKGRPMTHISRVRCPLCRAAGRE